MNIAFFNLREFDIKEGALQNAISALVDGRKEVILSLVEQKLIDSIPGNPFAYYAPRSMLTLSARGKNLAAAGVVARQGIGASARFHRLFWEVPPAEINTTWLYMAHGTPPSLFYKPTTHVFLWKSDGKEAKTDVIQRYPYLKGNYGFKIQAEDWYKKPGLCYGKRTEAFTVQILPAGHVFSFEGTAIFPSKSNIDPWTLLAFLNSAPVSFWLNVVCAEHKAYNYIEDMPLPAWNSKQSELAALAKEGWALQRKLDIHNITSPVFIVSTLLCWGTEEIVAAIRQAKAVTEEALTRLNTIKHEIDNLCFDLFAINGQIFGLEVECGENDHEETRNEFDEATLNDNNLPSNTFVEELFDYLVGVAFGRWDVRIAKGSVTVQKLPLAFDLLPENVPGALVSGVSAAEYPLAIPSHGVMVDSREHAFNAVSQIERAIQIIWSDIAPVVEQQLSAELAVVTLDEYLNNKYFNFHLRRYSKGRRYAPIYWPLSTPSSSYTLWLYYHRLTDQTLYICVNDFVDPKLKQVSDDGASLRSKSNRSSADEKELERLSDLEMELKDFRDELLRIARFWKPNLNDGVQITAAPLWNLFQHRQWKTRLKETWEKLEAGVYDWAHLALSIWPDRVVRASHKDRSYAIAHDLEDRLWHEVEVKHVGRGGRVTTTTEWQPRDLSSADLQTITDEVKAR